MVGIVALRQQFDALPDEVRNHFSKLRPLLENPNLEIALADTFKPIEQGRYRAIKCILVRSLRHSRGLVDDMFREYAFHRKTFRKALQDLIGVDINQAPYNSLETTEKIRDKVFHGRMPPPANLRSAISSPISFIQTFKQLVREHAGKNPFGDLRGSSSRMTMLPNSHATWIIAGVKLKAEIKS